MATGERSEAEAKSRDSVRNDPTDQLTFKRRIALKKDDGQTSEAIKLLNEYLGVFMGDTEAWQELAELYLALQSYDHQLNTTQTTN